MYLYQISTSAIHGEIKESYAKIINWKCQPQRRMRTLNYQMDHIL